LGIEVPPFTFQGNCHAKPKAARGENFNDEADGIHGDINDFVLTIAEKAADMICRRASSLVVDLPKEKELTRCPPQNLIRIVIQLPLPWMTVPSPARRHRWS
jgi:hypothetical protein